MVSIIMVISNIIVIMVMVVITWLLVLLRLLGLGLFWVNKLQIPISSKLHIISSTK